ncbi:MAG TPA: nicotinate phosphoribosyltransferase [Prolixibacteraceae bacterium]|nr:nicotinate phosphoribosyltransferase [Prolixibacteraceae bacterium]
MINYTGTYTDQYELTMAQVYFKKGRKTEKAVFDYFFRKLPFHSGYAVFAGLEDLLDALEDLHFDQYDLNYLIEIGFPGDFVNYLKDFQFQGTIFASREGDLVFPSRPVLRVEANIIEAQLIETLLLNILNFQTLIATKASRMRMVAGDRKLVDFGLRRAQGPGGYCASRAAVIGGFDATSNVRAGRDYGIPVSGTMAHSFIQSYDDELSAFRDFAEGHPNNCVLLVDTYDTLKSGIPNAIIVGKEMENRGHSLNGIRLDSGDLAYLSRQCRKMLDNAGLPNVKISVSNQLDEYVIKSLLEQEAPIDIFGVGTSLVVGSPDAALDGVYKLALLEDKPRIKLSENLEKITLPHKKQVFRISDSNDQWIGADAIALEGESDFTKMTHPFDVLKSLPIKDCQMEPLLVKVMENGKRLEKPRSLKEIASFSAERLKKLSPEYKRFDNPHIYKVGISDRLMKERDVLIETLKQGIK